MWRQIFLFRNADKRFDLFRPHGRKTSPTNIEYNKVNISALQILKINRNRMNLRVTADVLG